MKKSSYSMYPEQHFAVVRFKSGDLTFEDVLAINTAYKNDPKYSTIHFLVMIFLDCNPVFKEDNLEELIQEYMNSPQENNHIRSVFVVDTPKTTAFAHLMISHAPEDAFYCTTFEKAYEFLSPPFTYSEFLLKIEA